VSISDEIRKAARRGTVTVTAAMPNRSANDWLRRGAGRSTAPTELPDSPEVAALRAEAASARAAADGAARELAAMRGEELPPIPLTGASEPTSDWGGGPREPARLERSEADMNAQIRGTFRARGERVSASVNDAAFEAKVRRRELRQ
jgi:hypothetical protein